MPTRQIGDTMSDTPEVTDLGAIPGSGDGPAAPAPGSIQVTEIHPEDDSGSALTVVAPIDVQAEDWGTFSVRYRGARPQLVVTGGTTVPSVIVVVDGAGNILAEYQARPATQRITSRMLPDDQNELVCATPDCKPISLSRH
ncbi:hypothetical protein [Actinokineospora sp. NBRC 105648]|uniref:hypothetical protein n=1 Tax=Actinokineospora sp. NBRC 105648 TaxID=3032206 RepID=UPI0024A1B070|nr:hypothetical protein [Actinokineospora sp. NBRC 105648]GLZ37954.1 hypothetical protein Acsp05_15780 [Actinokineospora sp. NBRC 105648]